MIHSNIANANKRIEKEANRVLVLHPSNGAILAYCDTEEEADSFINQLSNLGNNTINKVWQQASTEWLFINLNDGITQEYHKEGLIKTGTQYFKRFQ